MSLWKRLLRMQVQGSTASQVSPWDADEAEFFARCAAEPDDIDVLVLVHAQWIRNVQRALVTVGLTAHELWECSLDDSFPSLRARKLWLAVGHHPVSDEQS